MEVNKAQQQPADDLSELEMTMSFEQQLPGRRTKWTLNKEAFDKLLSALGANPDEAAAKYVEIRTNLLRFFEWRGCPFPEDHADETINRVAKRISEGEVVLNPSSYCVGIARLLLFEIYKERARQQSALNELGNSEFVESDDGNEDSLECLRTCLQSLSTENRELIVGYYEGDKSDKIANRKQLSERLQVPINTLRMRALRLREKLQECLEGCLEKK